MDLTFRLSFGKNDWREIVGVHQSIGCRSGPTEEKSRTKLSRAVLVRQSLPYLRSSIWQDASRGGKEVVSTYESFALFYEGAVRAPSRRGCQFKFCSMRAREKRIEIRCTFRVSEYLRGIYDSAVRGIFTPWWIFVRPYLARLTQCRATVRRKDIRRGRSR